MINNENYFSKENNLKYMSTSQFKRFEECEALAMAEINEEITREETKALIVGSFIDAHFEGTMDIFKAKHPNIFCSPTGKNAGKLLADYSKAEYTIQRIERDPLFMQFMSGQKQVVMTGEIDGVPWKIKIDSYHPGKCIVDLKSSSEIGEVWKDKQKVNFIEGYQYCLQGASYQAIEGNQLPFFLAVASKEEEPDLEIFQLSQRKLDEALEEIKAKQKRFVAIKKGEIQPEKCGKCAYCRSKKVLTAPILYDGEIE